MHACEPDVRDLVQRLQLFHNHIADFRAGDFLFQAIVNLFLNVVYHPVDVVHGNGTFFARFHNACTDFIDVESLTVSAFFDDHDGSIFDGFVRGETLSAIHAFPATSYRRAVFVEPAVDHFAVKTTAVHTFHNAPQTQIIAKTCIST